MTKTQGEDIATMKSDISHIKERLTEHVYQEEKYQKKNDQKLDKIFDLMEKQQEKFAGKWVEKLLTRGGAIAAGVIITAIVMFIINGGLS